MGKMKTNRLVCLISNKKGDFRQVALTEEQAQTIIPIIADVQGGTIKVHRSVFPITLDKPLNS